MTIALDLSSLSHWALALCDFGPRAARRVARPGAAEVGFQKGVYVTDSVFLGGFSGFLYAPKNPGALANFWHQEARAPENPLMGTTRMLEKFLRGRGRFLLLLRGEGRFQVLTGASA